MKPSIGRIVEWREIPGWEGLYVVSEEGEIKRIRAGKGARADHVLKARCRSLYLTVNLCRDGRSEDYYVHRLVAEAFIGPRPDRHEVNHKDMDKRNNRCDNLEYVTKGENLAHSYANGRRRPWGNQNWRQRCAQP